MFEARSAKPTPASSPQTPLSLASTTATVTNPPKMRLGFASMVLRRRDFWEEGKFMKALLGAFVAGADLLAGERTALPGRPVKVAPLRIAVEPVQP